MVGWIDYPDSEWLDEWRGRISKSGDLDDTEFCEMPNLTDCTFFQFPVIEIECSDPYLKRQLALLDMSKTTVEFGVFHAIDRPKKIENLSEKFQKNLRILWKKLTKIWQSVWKG